MSTRRYISDLAPRRRSEIWFSGEDDFVSDAWLQTPKEAGKTEDKFWRRVHKEWRALKYYHGTKRPMSMIRVRSRMRELLTTKLPLGTFPVKVRRLSACQTMGSASTICSNKTGTLTLNQLINLQHLGSLFSPRQHILLSNSWMALSLMKYSDKFFLLAAAIVCSTICLPLP
ncbi:hypothetical protein FRX31_002475 [Thalictrum thalictroides]|uniref:Uncharacterized protein n=1 Tax=Thalictrum thalictroides TaxID=46969 RepID=A0A7J6XEF5_THATH|nr:hypothetical protein FRX31_002475 [Thalictrum thalictroides]